MGFSSEEILAAMTLVAVSALNAGQSPCHGDYTIAGFTGGQVREFSAEAERRARQEYMAELSLRRGVV